VENYLALRPGATSGAIDAASGGSFAAVSREAERLVIDQWEAVERVARALAERGRLTGDQVAALVIG
jgi:hypothetical protein